MSSRPKVLVGLLGLGLTVATFSLAGPVPAAQAVGGVFISEFHYDDNTTNDGGGVGEFVEVTAPAGTDLTGWTIQLVNGSNNLVYKTDTLSGTVADQADGWGTKVLTYAVVTNGAFQNGAPDGVALINPAGVVDEFISYEGSMTANLGTPPVSTPSVPTGAGIEETNATPGTHSLQRLVDGSWAGPAVATKGVPNGYDTSGGESLAATSEPDATATVDQPMTAVVLEATGGTPPYSWATLSTLPAGVTLSTGGELSGTPTETGTFPITATVTDDVDATADVTFTLTVSEPAAAIAIADIQGTGAATPHANETVTTQGVVTANYPTGGFNGFYLQTPGEDTTPGASDGIFVFGGGASTFDESTLQIGDSLEVTGTAKEFSGLTEIELGASGTVTDIADLGAAVPNGVIPGTDCALPGDTCLTGAALDAAKEEFEGELFQPTGDYTLTDVHDGSAYNGGSPSSSNFGELGLAANSTLPLINPTEIIDAQATAAIAARRAYNNAHRVILDDGSSTTYWNTSNTAAGKDTPMPWYSPTNQVRVGAAATFVEPAVLDFRFGWKLQPTSQVTDDGAGQVSFEQDRPAQPADVGGELKIGTFNVLNYFTTLGVDFGGCSSFNDRAGNPIAVNSCPGNGPRGAWNATSFQRQEAKIVNAINALDADVVSVEEIENSLKVDGHDRDEALAALVTALNADAGAGTWDFVPSPAEASETGNLAEQDVIRTGFIYKPASVELVGESDMLFGTTAFANAREPFAQAFKAVGDSDAQGFAVVVNHFKSKGCGGASGDNVDAGDGQSCYNGDRTRQAEALSTFASDFAAARGVDAIFLAGDFNSASQEDPMQVLYGHDYEVLEAENKWSYNFDGQAQSLDHVLANPAAAALVNGVDIWEVNANETVFSQYSRYNYNATILYDEAPFGASDHNPEIVGITPPGAPTTEIQILGTNDFHGRILQTPSNGEGGAAVLSGAVKQLRGQNPNTVFSAAGDLIGASTFESFIQEDKPTIDALNEAGLEVSAVGNHEFDQGYADLVDRVIAPYDAGTNPHGGAAWKYLATNIDEPEGSDKLAEAWTKDFGGVTVGFVGAVTEDLPSLVSPAGIEGLTVLDIVEATNAAAADLKAGGADVVVLLVHEGSPSTNCASANFTDPTTVWGNITQNTSADVDAIISGHTHLAYNCTVNDRPVVSAGQYGTNLNQLVFTVDDATGDVLDVQQAILPLMTGGTANYPADPAVTSIVNDAVAEANTLGAQVLGQIEAPFNRAKLSNGTTENRGGESTLGNLVAEVQRWATQNPESGSAQIAFMNPGGLRADMAGTINGDVRDLTYKQAASVQPFANTLVNMDLTGAQIETVLEQQWQRDAGGNVPSRPFLRLGVSEGFTYTYEETVVTASPDVRTGEVTGMWLDGVAIDPAATYSVTVNSFLASGGDNFREFANGAGKADTGKVDLSAMVDYMAEFGPTGTPLAVDYSQRAVEVEFPGAAPVTYVPGDAVEFDVASWAMSAPGDVQDTEIQVKLGDVVLGTAALDNIIGNAVYDAYGTAHVNVTIPEDAADGDVELSLVGAQTGTQVSVPITIEDGTSDVQILGINDFHGRILNESGSGSAGASVLSGAVKELRAENPNTVFSAAGDLIGASTFESFIQQDNPTIDALNEAGLEVSAAGNHEFDQGYEDLVGRVQDRADWEYIAANVNEPGDRDDLAETWTKDFDGVTVGFVGAVTEELPSLVSPAGIEGVTVDDIVESTNAAAMDLKAGGADLVVLLVHEGSPSTACDSANFTDPTTVWGNITQNTSADVDAIISGHTHLAYNCSFPVQQWVTAGRAVTERPVVSAGQYGTNLNQIIFTVDDATGEVAAKTQAILPLKSCTNSTACTNYPSDPAVDPIVADAVAQAEVLGAQVLGEIEAPFNRAKLSNGTTENRGGESTLGNLVAEVQRWATQNPESGSAQIAFMNPGGLRADMVGTVDGDVRDVTYKQAAVVQPFANTLVNMDLTGAQIETVLEQQWQRDAGGNVPSRPFLRLGVSEGFTYTYEEAVVTASPDVRTGEVTGMWLDGEPIDPAATYSVTVNSFLASGGDNFREFANGVGKADTGKVDLQAMVDYMAAFGSPEALPVDYSQRAVEVHNVAGSYAAGTNVTFDVESWTMSAPGDVRDTEITVMLGDTQLGTAVVDSLIGTAVYDAYGKAHIDVPLPASTPVGATELTLLGANTGTEVIVPITVDPQPEVTNTVLPTIDGTAQVGRTLTADPGDWSPEAETLAYQWRADGVDIADATGSTLALTAAEYGKRITVVVTASAAGHVDGTAASAPTAKVIKGVFTDVSVAITGEAKIGKVLTATINSWSPTPDQVTYQWFADGVAIDGATRSFLKLNDKDYVGKRISVKVTGTRPGYVDRTAGSPNTAVVVKGSVSITRTVAPDRIVVNQTVAEVTVTVTNADGAFVGGGVEIRRAGGSRLAYGKLVGGQVVLQLPVFTTTGLHDLTVDYLGSATMKPASRGLTVRVRSS